MSEKEQKWLKKENKPTDEGYMLNKEELPQEIKIKFAWS